MITESGTANTQSLRLEQVQRAVRLEYFTVFYNLLEGSCPWFWEAWEALEGESCCVGGLEFGHFEEQFSRVDPHPVRRMADHPLPKGEGEIHGLER